MYIGGSSWSDSQMSSCLQLAKMRKRNTADLSNHFECCKSWAQQVSRGKYRTVRLRSPHVMAELMNINCCKQSGRTKLRVKDKKKCILSFASGHCTHILAVRTCVNTSFSLESGFKAVCECLGGAYLVLKLYT